MFVLGFFSCQKEGTQTDASPAEVDVYVAGRMGDKEVYWKNGVPFELNISSPDLSERFVRKYYSEWRKYLYEYACERDRFRSCDHG